MSMCSDWAYTFVDFDGHLGDGDPVDDEHDDGEDKASGTDDDTVGKLRLDAHLQTA